MPLTIMLVDDHPLWRESLKKVIRQRRVGVVIAEASDGAAAVETAAATAPDVVVMDMALPTMGGAEATRRIRSILPEAKVLVLSSFEARTSVLDAVRAGACGYVLKTAGANDVVDAIRRVADGELVFPPRLSNVVLDEFRRLSESVGDGFPHRLALAGDSPVHREGLLRVLLAGGFDVFASGGSVHELEDDVRADPPDVWVLDFHTGARGLREAAMLREADPRARVLVLCQDSGPAVRFSPLADTGGGFGLLLRDRIADADHLADAIRRVASGQTVVDPEVVDGIDRANPAARGLNGLTKREREVLSLMAEGRSNQAIREQLFLSHKSLEKHIRGVFTKLGLEETADSHRRVQAVIAYLKTH